MRVDNTFFTKNEENLRAEHLEEGPKMEGPEVSASLASTLTHHCAYGEMDVVGKRKTQLHFIHN